MRSSPPGLQVGSVPEFLAETGWEELDLTVSLLRFSSASLSVRGLVAAGTSISSFPVRQHHPPSDPHRHPGLQPPLPSDSEETPDQGRGVTAAHGASAQRH